jgi:hypothetical protein
MSELGINTFEGDTIMGFRYFEFTNSTSKSLFWEIKSGRSYDKIFISIRDGEVGSNGQESNVELSDEGRCLDRQKS